MNQKRIERLIPLTFDIINDTHGIAKEIFHTEDGEREIKSIYNGYMNSLGPSIVQSGLIKSITAFSKKSQSETHQNRQDAILKEKPLICEIIKELLKKDNYYTANESNKHLNDILINRIGTNPTIVRIAEENRILEAIAAYKLVFDTFAKYKEKQSEGDEYHGA